MKKILFILFIIFFKNNIYADDKLKLGLEIFNNKAQCATCHSLEAAGADGAGRRHFDAGAEPAGRTPATRVGQQRAG